MVERNEQTRKACSGWLRWCQGKQKDSNCFRRIKLGKLTGNPINNTYMKCKFTYLVVSLSKIVLLDVDILIAMKWFEKE